MDVLVLVYSLLFTIICVSISVIYLTRNNSKSNSTPKGKVPPGSTGWPVIGEHIHKAISGPEKFISGRMARHSPAEVFKTSIMAVFCGGAGNKFLFSAENTGGLLATWWPKSVTRPLMSPTKAQTSQGKVAVVTRSFVGQFLKPENLRQYIPVMDSLVKEHVAHKWAPFGEVKDHPLAQSYTIELACKLFFSIQGQDQVKRLFDPYILVTAGLLSLPINLPGTAYNCAIKGGKLVRQELVKVIKERMQKTVAEGGGEDLLARLLAATDENEQHMNEDEICNSFIGLLVGSYDTTSAAITFTLKFLAELSHIYEKVFQEQMEIAKSKGPNELLNWEDIKKMKYSWNVACEALRLFPPSQGAYKEVLKDFTYEGFTIPKGWKTYWSVYTTHKNPKYFLDLERFDPSRFEGSGPAPYTFVPFGGGPRMCPGKEYARLEILVFIYNIVTNFKLEKLIPNEKIVFHAAPIPVNGLPLRLTPHAQK